MPKHMFFFQMRNVTFPIVCLHKWCWLSLKTLVSKGCPVKLYLAHDVISDCRVPCNNNKGKITACQGDSHYMSLFSNGHIKNENKKQHQQQQTLLNKTTRQKFFLLPICTNSLYDLDKESILTVKDQ